MPRISGTDLKQNMLIMDDRNEIAHIKPHALVVAFPTIGNLNPMLDMVANLLSAGFAVTFVYSTYLKSYVQLRYEVMGFRQHEEETTQGSRDFCMVEVSDCMPGTKARPTASAFQKSVDSIEGGVRQLLTQMNRPVTCIIANTLLSGMQDVANEFGIPKVDFWTSSAAAFLIYLHIPLLISKGYIPSQGDKSDLSEDNSLITCIPGLPPLRCKGDIAQELLVEDLSDEFFQLLLRPFLRVQESHCVLANTFHELEQNAIESMNKIERLSFVPIGPLVGCNKKQLRTEGEKDDCLHWLDKHAPASVIYISFGTFVVLHPHAIRRLALGIEASQHPFLWVIRHDCPDVPSNSLLPEGFCSGTDERGLVVQWAPQLDVLAHPSIGGFLSHCGWNSTLESIFTGVPILGLPFSLEQPTNLKLIVSEWKIGMALEGEREDNMVESLVIEKGIRALLQGREGQEVRERARRLRDAARAAGKRNGVYGGGDAHSDSNMAAFIADMKRRASAHTRTQNTN
eukprot:c26252_g1_i2 orf=123-1658(+)